MVHSFVLMTAVAGGVFLLNVAYSGAMRRREFLVSRAKRSSLKPRFNHRVRLLI